MLLLRVCAAFDAAGVRYAVAGGCAVALHGAVRGTVDVDVVVALRRENLESAENALRSLGLESTLPVDAARVFAFREEYIAKRNLVAWSFRNPSLPSEVVDIVLTHDLSKMKSARVKIGRHSVPVLAKRDLIAMKKESGRPQDLEDARALEAS